MWKVGLPIRPNGARVIRIIELGVLAGDITEQLRLTVIATRPV